MKKKPVDTDKQVLQTYFEQIKTIPLLTLEEEQGLFQRVQQGDEAAKRRLIEANLRLVVKIARAYLAADMPFNDIIQEGNIGLMKAAEKYDHTKNVRFSTYAGFWIRQSITRFLAGKRRIIHLPYQKEELLHKIQRAYHTLSQKLARQPSAAEIAGDIGVPVEEVTCVFNTAYGQVSLDMENGEGEIVSLIDLHEDYTFSPERTLMRKVFQDDTMRCLDRLKEREKRILMYRYQLNGCEHHTLKKISAKMGISPETVRQIELKALKKIRDGAEELWHSLDMEAM